MTTWPRSPAPTTLGAATRTRAGTPTCPASAWAPSSTTFGGMAAFQLREGDVVLAMDRPWIEAGLKYASVRRCDLPSLLVQRVSRLRGTGRLDTRFLKYVIGGRAFTEYILGVQTGTAVPHISAG